MTERTIPANAEGLSKIQNEAKAAFDTGLTLAALLNVCRAAAHLIEDDDGYIPLKPVGVRVNYLVVSDDETPMFGFDVENEFISGFDKGSWGISPA